MIKKSYYKDVFKSITHTLSRFISIFLMVALGAGFYAGLNATAPDMRFTINDYYKTNNMMDINLVSTMGFTESDINEIKQYSDIKSIMPSYSADIIGKTNETERIIKIHTIPQNDEENYINRAILKNGRLPQKAGECVINVSDVEEYDLKIGSKIAVSLVSDNAKDNLKTREFEIVGLVDSPCYITFNLGSSTIGNGKLNNYIYITEDNFEGDYYTEVFLTFKSTEKLQVFSQEYNKKINSIKEDLEIISKQSGALRKDEIFKQANEKINIAKAELENGKEKANAEFLKADEQINNNEKEFKEKQNQISQAKELINKNEIEIDKKEVEATTEIKIAQTKLDIAKEKLNQAQSELDLTKQMLDKTQQQINKLKEEIEKLKQQGLNDLAFEAEKSLKIISIEFEKGQKEYENGESQLKQGQKELEANQNSFNVKKISAENEITYARNQINEKRDELAQSELLIKKGEKDIEQGRTTLEQKKKQTYQELHDAEEEIKKSEEQLNNLPQPFWYYLDLETNYGYVSLKGDADRIAAIATIFPVIFFLVAALVALTTMTRMVEEERTLIGTYKALGYTKMRIGMKYITYGLISSFLGSLAGVFLGQLTLPSVIWNAYRMMYVAPSAILKIDGFYTTIAFICAVGVTILATFMALASSLKENAAMLMMPKAPKKGKQILLQRIPFIWNHLSFSYKVTFRNLFRYKKRLFMTIIGIAGCTGLLLTGFGVHDSISDIVSVQFREINKYDTTIQIKSDGLNENLKAILDDKNNLKDYIRVRQKSVDIINPKTDKVINGYTFLSEDSQKLNDFINIRERKGKQQIDFNADSVVITEKLAKQLGVSVGDKISFKETEEKTVELTITNICENYVYHYVYIGSNHFSQIAKTINFNSIIGQSANYIENKIVENEDLEKISSTFLSNEDVASISFTKDISNVFEDMIKSLSTVVLVLIFSAGLLAFIVLYNLTNINVNERKREIATIKVLGFFDNEVSSYIYRETIALTLIGIVAGLFAGVVMHSFVIQTAEVDAVMFGRNIAPLSFVWSALLTLAFSLIVNLVIHIKLKKINMVESLKSVD